MNEDILRFPFPVELLEKLAFEKEADVTKDTDNQGTVNTEHGGEYKGEDKTDDVQGNIQELSDEGGDFSNNLTNFLQAKKHTDKREEKIDKAEELGLVDPTNSPESAE